MRQSYSESFEVACLEHGDQIATIDPTGAAVSFSNLFYTVLAFAEALQDHGVRKGDLVAVHVLDAIAGTALKLALLRIGASAMGTTGADGSLGVAPAFHLIEGGAPTTGGTDIVVGRDWIRSPRRWVPIAGGGRMITSTSGTTGLPKLCQISDTDLIKRVQRSARWRGLPEGAVFIGYSPFSNPFFNHMSRAVLSGMTHIHPRADEFASLALMDRVGVQTAYLSPWNFRRILDAAEAGAVRPHRLRRIVTGGGELAPALATRAETIFNAEVILSYGSSETGSIAHTRPALHPDLPGCLGRPYADLGLRFQAEDGGILDPVTGGELWIKTPETIQVQEFPSGKPVTNADGWVGTGDLCRMLADGTLLFMGRRSELLNIGGSKVAPQLFEALARTVPGVADVAAFRLPEPGGGDQLGLAVVPGPGLDPAVLTTRLAAELGARYAFTVLIRSALPVTSAGKMDRRRLAAEHAEDIQRAVAQD